MNDAPPGEKKDFQYDEPVMEFVNEVSRDVERLRAGGDELLDLDPLSWRRVQATAHNIAARARGLQLPVLAHCACELEEFADQVLSVTRADKSESVHGAMVALEMIDLELKVLARSARAR